MIKRFLAAVVLIAMTSFTPSVAGASSPPTWTAPIQVGTELPSSWFPDIQADAAGTIRLVWSSSLIEGDANLSDELNGAVMLSELGDDGWSAPADIAVMDGGIASRPMIASDGQYAHLIFRTSDPGDPVRLVYARAPLTSDLSNAHSWTTPFVLSGDEAYWAQIALLPQGRMLVVYNRISDTEVDGQNERRTGLFARRSLDQGNTWDPETRVSDITERVARTSLSASPDGSNILLAWDEGYDNLTAQGVPTNVATAVSSDGGVSWSDVNRFAVEAEESVVATNGRTTVLIYRSVTDDHILYRTSADGGRSWSTELDVPNALARPYGGPHNFEKLSTAFDGDGRLLLAWVGPNEHAPNGLSVMLATYADGEWTEPRVLASPAGFPEYPRIAVALGTQLHLAFFVRDKLYDVGHYTMWVMSGTSDAAPLDAATFAPVEAVQPVVATPAPVVIESRPQAPVASTPIGVNISTDESPQATLTSPILPVFAATIGALLAIIGLRWLVAALKHSRI